MARKKAVIEEIIEEPIEPEYYIGKIFEGVYPPAAAIWCNQNNAYIERIDPIEQEVEETYIDEDGKEKTRVVVITVRRYEIKEVPAPAEPTHEDIKKMRAEAYKAEKDPITCHIQSLRDEEQTEEIIAEIESLIAERKAVVEAIKERLPYPDEAVEKK